jgi:hypothetical protein
MDDDSGKPPLARRVPGANLRARALPAPRLPVLSDTVLQRVRAAVEAERAWPGQPTPSARPRKPGPAEAGDIG